VVDLCRWGFNLFFKKLQLTSADKVWIGGGGRFVGVGVKFVLQEIAAYFRR